jgi:hypothetical protein
MKEDVQLTQIFVDKYKCMVHLVIMFNRVHINMNLYSLNFQQVVHEYNENLRSNRTLSYVGEKISYLSVKCMNASYNTFLQSDADHQCRWLTAQLCFYLSSRTHQPIFSHENNLSATNIY